MVSLQNPVIFSTFEKQRVIVKTWKNFSSLLALDWTVNMTDKKEGSTETNNTEHEKETIANTSHVPEEEGCLHEARHIWSCVVVIQAVAVDEQTGWSTTKEGPAHNRANNSSQSSNGALAICALCFKGLYIALIVSSSFPWEEQHKVRRNTW